MNSRDYIKLWKQFLILSMKEFWLPIRIKIIFYNNELAKWENLSKKMFGKHLMDVYDDRTRKRHIQTESGEPCWKR